MSEGLYLTRSLAYASGYYFGKSGDVQLERYFRGAKGDYYCSSDPAHFAKNVEPTTSANSGEVDRPVLRVSAQVTQAIHYAPGFFLIEQGQHFRLPIASRDREREFVDYKR